MAKPALGRGLGALLGGVPPAPKTPAPAASEPKSAPAATAPPAEKREGGMTVPLDRIHPCPFQPRKDFTQETLQELADSITEQGILQPLIVRSSGGGYELIAGERRWRAAQLAGLKEAPVIIREADDLTVLELALVENLQRENLNPIEEAQGYAQLMEQFRLTQEEAALKVGKSRATVANALRLLKLAPEVQSYLRDGLLSTGHAKVILGLDRSEQQLSAAHRVIKDALSVRQTEELVAKMQQRAATEGETKQPGETPRRDVHIIDLETRLQERFGTKVALKYRNGKGAVEIRFFNDDDMERILQIVGVRLD